MSPRSPSSITSPPRSANTPYSRRPSSQPKSSRQQFSACGACRMRRVRCDLKDLPMDSTGPHPACSNCRERNINCVDEFADVKAVKLLRRGRRLQQVEAIYGKINGRDGSPSSTGAPSKTLNSIPMLHADFFVSPFWRWLVVNRPILDATEFPARFAAHCQGTQPLENEGNLISMLLVTWAESFGLDERGLPQVDNSSTDTSTQPFSSDQPYPSYANMRIASKNKAELYLREILELLDYFSVLRRPTLDGLRVLFLLLPLMEDAPALERLSIYEAVLFQVHALCVQSAPNPPSFEDASVRARLFWYAYTEEGMLTGLRGSRLVLTEDDLEAFQRTLPPPTSGMVISGLPTPPPTSASREVSANKIFVHHMRMSSTPLELGTVCRKIHTVLAGSKATRRAEEHGLIDANGMREIWRDLDHCWQELDAMKHMSDQDNLRRSEVVQYVHAWQIFIFECHNVIREALKRFINSSNSHQYVDDPSSRPASSAPYMTPNHLHGPAARRCFALLPTIISILRTHSPIDKYEKTSAMFSWDSGLVRDGCFYAGYLAASMDREFLDIPDEGKQDDDSTRLSIDEAVSFCLDAIAAMRWGYSKSDERQDTIRLIWENRKIKQQDSSQNAVYDLDRPQAITFSSSSNSLNVQVPSHLSGLLPPPISIPRRSVQSAPNTACSTDGRGLNGWPTYTPPGTATSITTSSGVGSPVFANMPPFKTGAEDMYYHSSHGETDQFLYNVPLGGSLDCENTTISSSVGRYSQRHSPSGIHAMGSNPTASYMDSHFHTPSPSILNDFQSCPQFGENCSGTYH